MTSEHMNDGDGLAGGSATTMVRLCKVAVCVA